MLFADLAQYFERIEKTPSRLEMTAILAELIKRAPAADVPAITYLSQGRLGPLYDTPEFQIAQKLMIKILARSFNVDEKQVKKLFSELGDLGDTAYRLSSKLKVNNAKLTVNEVFYKLNAIAKFEGQGSVEKKMNGMAKLLQNLDPLSARFVVRIVLKKMRLGFTEKTIIEALSWMKTGDKGLKHQIEAAYHIYPDIGEIAAKFKKAGPKDLKDIKIRIGAPVLPALCQRLKTPEEMIEKLGGTVAAEPKFDGQRLQLHLDRRQKATGNRQPGFDLFDFDDGKTPDFLIKMFTRNLDEVSSMFPELILAAKKQINAQSAILDGEVIGVDPKSGKLIPFQETIKRKRKYGVREKAAEIPAKYFVFDLLYLDGQSLLKEPFKKRRERLEKLIKKSDGIALTPQTKLTQPTQLKNELAREVKKGAEGLVVKNPDAEYEAGARGFSWVKFKPEKDTIDGVILGYYFGRGKRVNFGIGAFLIGVYDDKSDRFKTLSKIGTGLTDEQWRELKIQSSKFKVQNCPQGADVPKELTPDVWVRPAMVVEIQFDEITKSPLHSAGYALRFPRLVRFRDDKKPPQATTVKEIKELFASQ
jgi:DNA ligase-1